MTERLYKAAAKCFPVKNVTRLIIIMTITMMMMMRTQVAFRPR